MTNPNIPATPAPAIPRDSDQPRAEGFLDWFHVNGRLVGIGSAVVVLAVFGIWFWTRADAIKKENADKALLAAKQALYSGNAQLAESDLKKVSDRYDGTPAGAEAGMLLATAKLERGDNAGATAYLKELTGKLTAGPNAAAARGLLGDAMAQDGKTAEAAAEYEKAAGLTAMPNEKTLYLSKAGHAYQDAGKSAEARKVWESLAGQQDNQAMAVEARVRLGELTAAGKS